MPLPATAHLVKEVTTKRGFSFPSMCSPFAATRRARSQSPFFVFLVWYSISVKTRAGLPVCFHCSVASCICAPIILRSFLLRAIPHAQVHALALTPAHKFVAAEAGVSAHNDFYLRPGPSNLLHRSFYFLPAAEGGIVIGLAQARAQNVFSAENIQRQIAVAVVIAMKEPSLLPAVQRQVGGVDIQDDLFRSTAGAIR